MMFTENVVTPDQVEKLLKEGKKFNIIDVREHEEVAYGKIPGAQHIPLGELQDRVNEIKKDEEHVMVCRSGNRSGMATQFLNSMGFKAINMVGGMMNWTGELE